MLLYLAKKKRKPKNELVQNISALNTKKFQNHSGMVSFVTRDQETNALQPQCNFVVRFVCCCCC